MITVNLLPHDLRPIKRTPLPYFLSAAAFGLVVMAIGATFIGNQAKIFSANRQLNAHQTELDQLAPIVEEYNSLTAQKSRLAEQVQTIDEIASDRIIWSRQLHNLSRLTLENQWYSGISVTSKPFEEQKPVVNAQTGQTEYQTVSVSKPVLTVSGYVIPGVEGTSDMSLLAENFAQDEEFASLFEIDKPSFEDTTFGDSGIPVRKFQIEYIIHPGGIVE